MGTLSTDINPAAYGELATGIWVVPSIVDGTTHLVTAVGAVGDQAYYVMPRPGVPGTVVLARDYETGTDLPVTALDERGYIPTYSTGNSTTRLVVFSVDNWTKQIGPLPTLEALVASVQAGTLVQQALTASTAAQSAATAASASAAAAQAAAANAVQTTQAGQIGGFVPIAADGRMSSVYAPQDVLDRITDLEDVGSAVATAVIDPTWEFDLVDAYGNNTLVVGAVGKAKWVPYPILIDHGPRLTTDQASATLPIEVDIEANVGGSGWTSIYGATRPTIPAGATENASTTVPTTQSLAAGALWRPKLTAVPPAPIGSGTAATFDTISYTTAGTNNHNNSGTGTSNSLPVPMPTAGEGAATGDTVYLWVANGGSATLSLPSPWVQRLNQASATPKVRLTLWTAPWSVSLAATVTNSGLICATAVLVTGANEADPAPQTNLLTAGESLGASAVSASGAADQAYDQVMIAAATYYQNTGATGYTIAAPGSTTMIKDQQTARVAASNLELVVVKQTTGAVADGATIAARTFTAAGGTGSLSANSWATAAIGVPRAPGTAGPSSVTVQMVARATVDA